VRSDSSRVTRRRLLAGGLSVAALGAGAAGYRLSRTPVGLLDGQSRARAVTTDDALPAAVDVAIIGGGFVGTSAALTLAERGVSTALFEKGVIAGEASGRSMGYIDSQLLDPGKMDLVARSKAIWAELNTRTGLETGYRPTGLVESLGSPDEVAGAEAWLAAIRGMPGADGRILRAKEIAALYPGMVDPPPAALLTPGDASAEPQLAAPAMAEAAQNHGARILQRCAVRGLEFTDRRVSAVVTERGRVACQSVVLAGGAWTPLFASSLGVQLPQLEIFLSMMGLSAVAGPKVPLSADGYGFRPQIDGGYSFGVVDFAAPIQPATLRNFFRLRPAVEAFWPMAHVGVSPSDFWRDLVAPSTWRLDAPSPFEARRVLVPEFRAAPLIDGLARLHAHFPVFRGATVRDRWSGIVTSFPDNMPVIAPVRDRPGLYIGTGFTYGLTMGPAAGEALADLATGRVPVIDLHPYRLERFSDGTPLEFHG